MKKNMQGGFTLVELMVYIALFPTIFLAIFSTLDMANVIFHTNDAFSRLNQNAMQTLRYISREIGQTSPNVNPSHLNIAVDGAGNSVVRFQIPVDWDNDGDAVTGTLDPAVEWGNYDEAGQVQTGRLGGWARYSVVNNQLIREVLDATLTPVANLSHVVANDVQNFTVNQAQNTMVTSLTVQVADTVGQAGTARNLQMTFSSNTILRNAVN